MHGTSGFHLHEDGSTCAQTFDVMTENDSSLWSKLRFPVALSAAGELVWARKTVARELYECPSCHAAMHLRAGVKVRAHFAHVPSEQPCSPESVLHASAKLIVKEAIERFVAAGEPYTFQWECPECFDVHSGNLAASPRIVQVEKSLGSIRPDLTVESRQGTPLVAIEIVVTHNLEESTKAEYERLKLPVVVIVPTVESLKTLRRYVGKAFTINAPCRHARCARCGGFVEEVQLQVWDGCSCYHCGCGFPMLDVMEKNSGMGIMWHLPKSAIAIASQLGVRLEYRYSKTAGSKYPMHICPQCDYAQGDWFLRKQRMNMDNDKLKCTADYWQCDTCDLWWPSSKNVQ